MLNAAPSLLDRGLFITFAIAGALSAFPSQAHCDDQSEPNTSEPVALIQEFYSAHQRHDIGAMAESYDEGIIRTDKDGVTQGKLALLKSDAEYAKAIREFKQNGGKVRTYVDVTKAKALSDNMVLVITEYYHAVESNGRYTGRQTGYDVYTVTRRAEGWKIVSVTETSRVMKASAPSAAEEAILRELEEATARSAQNIRRLLRSAGK